MDDLGSSKILTEMLSTYYLIHRHYLSLQYHHHDYESDPRSNEHYLSSSENKAWKKIQASAGSERMTSVIPVQRSTNWANKPTGSWLLCWFQIYDFHIFKVV